MEFGDTLEKTLREEIKQEYCADVLEAVLLGPRDAIRKDEGILRHWVAIDYLVRIDPLQLGNGEPHKFKEVRFWHPSEYPKDNCHSQLPNFLSHHKEVLKVHGLEFS